MLSRRITAKSDLPFSVIPELLDKEDTTGLTLRESLAKQAIKNNLPQADLNDWLQRRLKNYHVNKSLTELTAKYRFHYLAIGKDDNAPLSATHMEARYIKRDAFALSDQIFQIIPGVDQLGMLLLTRAVNEKTRAPACLHLLCRRHRAYHNTAVFRQYAWRICAGTDSCCRCMPYR